MVITAIPAGFAAGLFGIGGGLITVPILFYIFSTSGIEPKLLFQNGLSAFGLLDFIFSLVIICLSVDSIVREISHDFLFLIYCCIYICNIGC